MLTGKIATTTSVTWGLREIVWVTLAHEVTAHEAVALPVVPFPLLTLVHRNRRNPPRRRRLPHHFPSPPEQLAVRFIRSQARLAGRPILRLSRLCSLVYEFQLPYSPSVFGKWPTGNSSVLAASECSRTPSPARVWRAAWLPTF